MTIINYASDGLYPELIALFRSIAHLGTVDAKSVIDACSPWPVQDAGNAARLKGALGRWTELGLFVSDGGNLKIHERFNKKKRGESVNDLSARLERVDGTIADFIPSFGNITSSDATGVGVLVVRNDVKSGVTANMDRTDLTISGDVTVNALEEADLKAAVESSVTASGGSEFQEGTVLAVNATIATNAVLTSAVATVTNSSNDTD